jgi:hypothetical protein
VSFVGGFCQRRVIIVMHILVYFVLFVSLKNKKLNLKNKKRTLLEGDKLVQFHLMVELSQLLKCYVFKKWKFTD